MSLAFGPFTVALSAKLLPASINVWGDCLSRLIISIYIVRHNLTSKWSSPVLSSGYLLSSNDSPVVFFFNLYLVIGSLRFDYLVCHLFFGRKFMLVWIFILMSFSELREFMLPKYKLLTDEGEYRVKACTLKPDSQWPCKQNHVKK